MPSIGGVVVPNCNMELCDMASTYFDKFMHERLIAPVLSSETSNIMFDSGACVNVCPLDFAAEWPLLPYDGGGFSPLKTVSGSPITTYGRRLCGMKFGNATLYIHFYVCDVK